MTIKVQLFNELWKRNPGLNFGQMRRTVGKVLADESTIKFLAYAIAEEARGADMADHIEMYGGIENPKEKV